MKQQLDFWLNLLLWLFVMGFVLFIYRSASPERQGTFGVSRRRWKRIGLWITGIMIAGVIAFVLFRFLSPQNWAWGTIIIGLPLWFLAIFACLIFLRIAPSAGKSPNQHFEQTLKGKVERVRTSFEDVGGLEKAKKTLLPIIEWLNNPQDKTLGGDIPRGVLLTGPSGSGKTLLARAFAGNARVDFFYYSASEFVELFVGVGALRIRNLFDEARKASQDAPCIVCIDQIDVIGSEHSAESMNFGSTSEAHQALIQLLKELDDLDANGRVYVIGATSRPRVLDPALTMPRRLGLRIDLQLPDKNDREEILNIQLKKIFPNLKIDQEKVGLNDTDLEEIALNRTGLEKIALSTEGWSGAELEHIVSQAAEIAKNRSQRAIQQPASMNRPTVEICLADFAKALDRMLPRPKLNRPDGIVSHLNKTVIGQTTAKKRLAVAVSNHYLRLSAARRLESFPASLKKSNVLLIGPTGTGKTFLIETIADYLDVPYVIFNSTVLTETGYSGASVEQVLYKLIVAADLNLRKAEYGIICIDEFDKLAFHQGERTRQTGAGVQQELLKIIEGTVVDVPKTGGIRRVDNTDYYQFNTRNILFVCLGAFIDIVAVIERRLKGAPGTDKNPRPELLKSVQPEDVITFGFIPELIGRFPVITFTEPLTVKELTEILQNPHNGLVNEYRVLLELQGWTQPNFDEKAVERIAREASRRGVGARGLRGIMEEVLLEKMYERPNNGEIRTLSIDESWVEQVFDSGQSLLNDIASQTSGKIIEKLEERLAGNLQAIQTLAVVSYNHYRHQVDSSESKSTESETIKQAVLLVDPYTSQRLRLIQELANCLKLPWVIVSAENLERSLNARVDQRLAWLFEPIQELLQKANFNLQKAQQGIIFIDDFDLTLAKVTVRAAYSTLQQHLGEIIQGRSLPLQFGSGHTIEFKTDCLFFVLGGEFLFTDRFSKSFMEDGSLFAKYQPGNILQNLITDYGLSLDLLQYLIVVTTDLTLSQERLERIIKEEYKQLKLKYANLLAHHGLPANPTSAEYERWMKNATENHWNISDIRAHLESELMQLLPNKE